MVRAVVTGGGTSGHVIPAQAILEALIESGYRPEEVKYVGSRRGIEKSLMQHASWESHYLPISGLQRSLSIRSLLRNASLVWRLGHSRVLAHRLMKKWQPQVVVSVGGYASQPMASAAKSFGVPLVCVSYDRIPGLATRRQSRYAKVCTVAFADTRLPRAVHTGAPVRNQLRTLDVSAQRNGARQRLGIAPNATCLAIVGGSLGSGVLNAAVGDIAAMASGTGEIVIFHVCGPRNENDSIPVVPEDVTYIRRGYISAMADLYAACDVLLARAGASTVAEIATVGVASVLVPWAGAVDNHQLLNASWLSDQGGAVLMSEDELRSAEGVQKIVELLRNGEAQKALASSAFAAGALHRGPSLVEVIQNATA
jgi:UDP-N-acetylglucosamine--N-acetylmuramyl-(pentapeptide) pyrophosphoryl-undecaprenol N-acetylglucosamine transferase